MFRDRDELTGAADLGSTVTAALDASRHLIVICSPAAAGSRWVDEEVRTFKRMGRAERILTLVFDGEPNASGKPGHDARECFSPALRFELDPEGGLSGRRTEPVAADLRPGKDGRTNAKLKLIAGLLGVGFDELKQREHRRQQRRLLAVTAAALTGVLITGALAITAWLARQDAVRNRDRAEDLIGFMLGEFRQQLESLGKLELLKGVGDEAMAYFSSLDERDITNESLLRRAEALRQIGDVRLALGEFEPALAAFQESLNLSRELSSRSPDNQDWLFALGNAWFWVGYTHWQLEQGYAFANLGSLAAARGESDAAIGYFEGASAVVERLIADAPTAVGLLRTRIENYSWLASIHQGRGELRAAKVLHARALQLTTELLASRPDDRRIQREEVLRQVFYGRVLLLMGDPEEAERVSRKALTSAHALAALDPENARWQWQLASVMEQVSRVLRARGRCTEAVSMAEAGLAITTGLAEKASDMDIGHLTQLQLSSGKAACLLEAGRLDESETALASLLARTRVPDEKSVNTVPYEIALAMSRLLAGQIETARGHRGLAGELWTAGLGMLAPSRSPRGARDVAAVARAYGTGAAARRRIGERRLCRAEFHTADGCAGSVDLAVSSRS